MNTKINRTIRDQNKELTVQEAKSVVTGKDRAILEADQEASNEGGADLGLQADNDDKAGSGCPSDLC